jgi:hypothetical protein
MVISLGFTIVKSRSTRKKLAAYAHATVIVPTIQWPAPAIATAASFNGSTRLVGIASNANDW